MTVPGTADPSCPVNNGETHLGNMGMEYLLLCDTRFSEATLETQTQDRIGSCISACDMYNTLKFYLGSQCLGINYYPEKTQDNCLLKAGSSGVREFGTIAGRLVAPQGGGEMGAGPGTGPGEYGSTVVGSMSASPVFTTGPARTETETTTTVSISYLPSTVLSVSTVYSGGSSIIEVTRTSISYLPASTQTETTTTTSLIPTTIYLTSTTVSTYISQGTPYITSIPVTSAIVSYGPAPTQTETTTTTAISYVPSTIYGISTAVSSFVSNSVSFVISYGVSTIVSISYAPAPTQTETTTTTRISYVPSTIYEIRTTVSTYVSNGVSYVTSYGVSTAVSVSYIPASTNTVTTTLVSISVSERTIAVTTAIPNTNPNTFGPPGSNTYGPPGPGGGTVTVTETPTGANTYGPGGMGGGGVVTITQGGSGGERSVTATTTVYVTRTVAPSSRSASASSFTCRTYATNYLNGGNGGVVPTGSFKKRDVAERGEMAEEEGVGKKRRRGRRSIFDAEVVLGENAGGVGEGIALWWVGGEDGEGSVLEG